MSTRRGWAFERMRSSRITSSQRSNLNPPRADVPLARNRSCDASGGSAPGRRRSGRAPRGGPRRGRAQELLHECAADALTAPLMAHVDAELHGPVVGLARIVPAEARPARDVPTHDPRPGRWSWRAVVLEDEHRMVGAVRSEPRAPLLGRRGLDLEGRRRGPNVVVVDVVDGSRDRRPWLRGSSSSKPDVRSVSGLFQALVARATNSDRAPKSGERNGSSSPWACCSW